MNMTYDVGNPSLGLGQAYKYLDLKIICLKQKHVIKDYLFYFSIVVFSV